MKKNILRTHNLPYVQNPKLGNRGKFFFTSNFERSCNFDTKTEKKFTEAKA